MRRIMFHSSSWERLKFHPSDGRDDDSQETSEGHFRRLPISRDRPVKRETQLLTRTVPSSGIADKIV